MIDGLDTPDLSARFAWDHPNNWRAAAICFPLVNIKIISLCFYCVLFLFLNSLLTILIEKVNIFLFFVKNLLTMHYENMYNFNHREKRKNTMNQNAIEITEEKAMDADVREMSQDELMAIIRYLDEERHNIAKRVLQDNNNEPKVEIVKRAA